MNDLDKLRVMLPHWIEHNHGHGAEFSQWIEKLEKTSPETAALLSKAVHSLRDAQNFLEDALNKAGGPLAAPGHKHEDDHKEHKHGDNAHHHHHHS
jgi:hypothetical protein